jgi:hypothetical protein
MRELSKMHTTAYDLTAGYVFLAHGGDAAGEVCIR